LQNKDRSRVLESARLPHTLAPIVFLGIDDRAHASHQGKPAKVDPLCPGGIPYFAIDVGKDGAEYEKLGGEWGDARGSANAMDGWTAGVFAQARALIDWNVRNKVSWCEVTYDVVVADDSSVPLAAVLLTAYGLAGSAAVPRRLSRKQVKSLASRCRACTTSHTLERIR
jgi:NAD+ diphosphatase